MAVMISPGRYWPITIGGYVLQMSVVPLLALAGNWQVAAVLIIAEPPSAGTLQLPIPQVPRTGHPPGRWKPIHPAITTGRQSAASAGGRGSWPSTRPTG
jgi:hypothetical protein